MQEPRKGTPSHMPMGIPTATIMAMATAIRTRMSMRISPRKLRVKRMANCITDAVPRV